MPIYFYSDREKPYGCFSNFSAHGFKLDGHYWRTSEHYFQAQKFVSDPIAFARVRDARAPKIAAEIGRDRSLPLREDWNDVKDDAMRRALRAKFAAHDDICAILMGTGDEVLVENAPGDFYWGVGKGGSGQNKLGLLLMELRSELRNEGNEAAKVAPTQPNLPELAEVPSPVRYAQGDATTPPAEERPAVIVHIVNDAGKWGKGFVMALSARWPEPEKEYRAWASGRSETDAPPFSLGAVQFVGVAPGVTVANLVGQHGTGRHNGQPPIRYEAVRSGLQTVRQWAQENGESVHMPRIGCGLAGGNWETMGRIVEEEFTKAGASVTVYDLPSEAQKGDSEK